jgi:hypothetical protein
MKTLTLKISMEKVMQQSETGILMMRKAVHYCTRGYGNRPASIKIFFIICCIVKITIRACPTRIFSFAFISLSNFQLV